MNWQSYLVLGIIIAVVAVIVIKGIINKKKGKSSCGCGCEGCAFKNSCHSNDNENK